MARRAELAAGPAACLTRCIQELSVRGSAAFSRNDVVDLGSAPAPGAVGRAFAAHGLHQIRSLFGEIVHARVRRGARRTAAEAAALLISSNYIVTASGRFSGNEPTRLEFWKSCQRSYTHAA